MKRILFCCVVLCAATACNRQQSTEYTSVEKTYVHKYGVTVPESDWIARGKDGEVVEARKDGVTVTRSYVQGVLEGKTTHTFPHSHLIAKIEDYEQGKLVQELKYYFSGVPEKETLYQSGGVKKTTYWQETGAPLKEEIYQGARLQEGHYFDGNQEEEATVLNFAGSRRERDPYGHLTYSDQIEGGYLVERTYYYPNQSPKKVIPYVNGKIEGQLYSYLSEGEPDRVENWVGGKKEGLVTLFQNGEKRTEISYVNDQKHGEELRFGEAEKVVERITWIEGQKQGPHHLAFGERVETRWYYKGQLVTKAKYDLMQRTSGNGWETGEEYLAGHIAQ